MNASVTLTDRLKFVSAPASRFAAMNSRMSGCAPASTPMLAPRRLPPCLMFSVAQSKMRMKETGPDASPEVEATRSPRGRSRENEDPGAPPGALHERHLLQCLEDALHRVLDREHEAGAQLSERGPGIHERRAVGQELPAGEQRVEALRPGRAARAFRLGDG